MSRYTYWKKGSKYRNVSTEYNGIRYHSKAEAAYAQELDLRMKAKDIKDWDRQIKVSLDVNGSHICNYYVDFKIIHNDDSVELVEIKGRFLVHNEVWVLKRKLMEAVYLEQNPDVKYSVVTV